jgi:DNA polymerase III alpha subunit (gram-positive type)
MIVLGLDLETTELDLEKSKVIEIGLVTYDTETKQPVHVYSEIVKEPDRPNINLENNASGLTDEVIEKWGIDSQHVVNEFKDILFKNDPKYIVAHNGNKFDKLIMTNFLKRHQSNLPGLPWFDTMTDIAYPKFCTSRNLTYLAAFHGFVNPFPHRALFDVMTMLRVLSNYNFDDMLKRAESPTITLQAGVNFDTKDSAKAQGFLWEPTKKIWYKEIKECDLTDEWINSLPFSIDVLE